MRIVEGRETDGRRGTMLVRAVLMTILFLASLLKKRQSCPFCSWIYWIPVDEDWEHQLMPRSLPNCCWVTRAFSCSSLGLCLKEAYNGKLCITVQILWASQLYFVSQKQNKTKNQVRAHNLNLTTSSILKNGKIFTWPTERIKGLMSCLIPLQELPHQKTQRSG